MPEGKKGSGEYEGILYKKPTNLSAYLSWSGWRSRYCVADDDRFKYYGKKGDPTPRGVVEFAENCRVENKGLLDAQQKLYGFDLIKKDGSVISFASKSKEDVSTWANVLELKIRNAALSKTHQRRWRSSSNNNKLPEEPVGQQPEQKDESDNETVPDSDDLAVEEMKALYGQAPEGFQFFFERHLRTEELHGGNGWELHYVDKASRTFERSVEYAGNSSTDINALFEESVGCIEMKKVACIPAKAVHLFAMLLDVSASRKAWDKSFVQAQVLRAVDLHNDVVRIETRPLLQFLVQPRVLVVERYWCREANGTYIIHCRGVQDGKGRYGGKGGVECDVPYYFVSVSPRTSPWNDPSAIVTMGVRVNVQGWMQYVKPWAKLMVLDMLSSVDSLYELAARRVVALGESAVYPEHMLPFDCELQRAMLAKANQNDEDIKLSDPYAIVEFLREFIDNRKTQTSVAFERAQRAMEEEKVRLSRRASQTETQPETELQQEEYESEREEEEEEEVEEVEDVEEKEVVEKNYTYAMPRNNYLIPMAISKEGVSAWWDSGVEEGYWKVRGPNYLTDKVKVPNTKSAMELVQMQWSFYDEPKRNIAKFPDELIQLQHEGRADRPFILVINFMVPTIGNWACYFAKRRTVSYERFDRMLKAFVEGTDEYRNSRFKIIPSVVEGSYIAKRGIGNTPAILGKKLTTTYYRGTNWFEVCVDVGSSRVAGSLMSLVKSYAASLVIDLAFLFESQEVDELPEVLIGGGRMHLPLMYPVDDLLPYCKSKEALEKAYEIPPCTVVPKIIKRKVIKKTKKKQKQTEPNKANVHSENKEPLKEEDNGEEKREMVRRSTSRGSDYVYDIPANNYLVPMELSKSGQSAWWDSGTDVGYWKLRGPSYLVDKIKVPSEVSAMELVQMQWSFFPAPKRHIAADPEELVQREHVARPDRPFLFVINFMVPTVGNWVCYFAKRRGVNDAKFDRMLHQFITHEDDKFRNDRFKIIPSVLEGYFVARKAIGSQPAILGRKIKTEYFRGDNYFEVCVDVGSSRVAESLLSVVKSYASSLVIDLAFLFESKTEEELPERLLGGARMHFPLMYEIPIEDFKHQYYK